VGSPACDSRGADSSEQSALKVRGPRTPPVACASSRSRCMPFSPSALFLAPWANGASCLLLPGSHLALRSSVVHRFYFPMSFLSNARVKHRNATSEQTSTAALPSRAKPGFRNLRRGQQYTAVWRSRSRSRSRSIERIGRTAYPYILQLPASASEVRSHRHCNARVLRARYACSPQEAKCKCTKKCSIMTEDCCSWATGGFPRRMSVFPEE
jgi:hypothetical protein